MTEYSFSKATAQHRLGGWAVDLALNFVTFGIGWFIWSVVVWGQGQTPGKQLLKMCVYDKTTGRPVKWGHMAIRQFLLPLACFIALMPFALVTNLLTNYGILPVTGIWMGKYIEMHLVSIVILYGGALILFLVDTLWIFRGEKKNRLVDVFAKTDVLNESPK